MIMMCQSGFVNYNKCTTLMQDVDSRKGYVETRDYMGTLCFLLNFSVNLKLL